MSASAEFVYRPRFVWWAYLVMDLVLALFYALWFAGLCAFVLGVAGHGTYWKILLICLAVFAPFFSVARVFIGFWTYRHTVYRILADRVEVEFGLLGRRRACVKFADVATIEPEQRPVQRWIATTTLVLRLKELPLFFPLPHTRLEDVPVVDAQRLYEQLLRLKAASSAVNSSE